MRCGSGPAWGTGRSINEAGSEQRGGAFIVPARRSLLAARFALPALDPRDVEDAGVDEAATIKSYLTVRSEGSRSFAASASNADAEEACDPRGHDHALASTG